MLAGHENARCVLHDYHWAMYAQCCLSVTHQDLRHYFSINLKLSLFYCKVYWCFKTNDRSVLFLRQLSTLTIVLSLEKRTATFFIAVSRNRIFLPLVP